LCRNAGLGILRRIEIDQGRTCAFAARVSC